MDVFEKVRESIGCPYISDMAFGAPYNALARASVQTMELEGYGFVSLLDLWEYLTGKKADISDKHQLIQKLQTGGTRREEKLYE